MKRIMLNESQLINIIGNCVKQVIRESEDRYLGDDGMFQRFVSELSSDTTMLDVRQFLSNNGYHYKKEDNEIYVYSRDGRDYTFLFNEDDNNSTIYNLYNGTLDQDIKF